MYNDEQSVLFAVLIVVTKVTSCPDPGGSEWKTKELECSRQDSSGAKYHCQYDANTQLMADLCALPVDCSQGTHAQIDESAKTVNCVQCSPDMYQPTAKPSHKFTQPNCDHLKTRCEKYPGKLQCGEATASQDYQCKCDYTQGFRPNNIVSECDCFIEDFSICVCQKAYCTEGKVLASNFSCITHVPITTVSTTQMPSAPSAKWIAGPVIGGIIAIAAIVIYLVVWKRRKRKRRNQPQPDAKNNEPSPNAANNEPPPHAENNEPPHDGKERTERSELSKENGTDNGKSETFPLLPDSEDVKDNKDIHEQDPAKDGRSSRTITGVSGGDVSECNVSGTSGGQVQVRGDNNTVSIRIINKDTVESKE